MNKIDCESGGFNSGHLWKLKSKLIPTFNDNPTAVMDKSGVIVTSAESITEVHVEHFKKVLENRSIKSGLEGHKQVRSYVKCE